MEIRVDSFGQTQHPREHNNQRNIQYKQRMKGVSIKERLPSKRYGVFRAVHSTHSVGPGGAVDGGADDPVEE